MVISRGKAELLLQWFLGRPSFGFGGEEESQRALVALRRAVEEVRAKLPPTPPVSGLAPPPPILPAPAPSPPAPPPSPAQVPQAPVVAGVSGELHLPISWKYVDSLPPAKPVPPPPVRLPKISLSPFFFIPPSLMERLERAIERELWEEKERRRWARWQKALQRRYGG